MVLISIDTLRADYLHLYDSKGIQTPNLESLAAEGVVFERAISQIPYTLPSHGSMLTGLYPVAHGVKDNVHDVLPKSIPTLAEKFKQAGYQTGGFIGSMVLAKQTGLARGFDYYDDYFSRADVRAEDLGGIERRADEVLGSFQNWFNKRNPQQNYFAFLHFYDPHSPYDPPAEFRPSGNDMKDLYKGEIRYVDSVLGKLFSYLKQQNSWNDTIVLVTSDHGEMLGEHGELGHGFFVYQPALLVPLLIHTPNSPTEKSHIRRGGIGGCSTDSSPFGGTSCSKIHAGGRPIGCDEWIKEEKSAWLFGILFCVSAIWGQSAGCGAGYRGQIHPISVSGIV